jgi:hypothetical protein
VNSELAKTFGELPPNWRLLGLHWDQGFADCRALADRQGWAVDLGKTRPALRGLTAYLVFTHAGLEFTLTFRRDALERVEVKLLR